MQKEKIYVVYTYVLINGSPFLHKDLYYERNDGTVEIMRGQPGKNLRLTTQLRLFKPLKIERDRKQLQKWQGREVDRELIFEGADISRQADIIRNEFIRIKNLGLRYRPTDTNSNWSVDMSLIKAGLPLPKKDLSDENWSPGSIKKGDTVRSSNSYKGGNSDLHFGKPNYHRFDDAETDINPNQITKQTPRNVHPDDEQETKPKHIKLLPELKKITPQNIPQKGPKRVDLDPEYNPLNRKLNGFEDLTGEVHLLKKDKNKFKRMLLQAGRSGDFKQIMKEDAAN